MGSTIRYYPFGHWRTVPTADLTDQGFTGHMHDMNVGLIYMNARWYSAGIARFLSPDTIVPDPANPQSYNRYSYVRNAPLNFTDPTGHIEAECSFSGECGLKGDLWKIHQMPSYFLDGGDRFIGFGGSISISIDSPFVSAGIVLGREIIIDMQEFENTTFVYGGGSFSMGANGGSFTDWMKRLWSNDRFSWSPLNTSMSLYLLDIENVEDPVTDYSGVFLSETSTAAFGPGVVWGEAYSPNDPYREKAHADIYGYTQGMALTKDLNVTGYVPVKTTSWFNPIPTFHDPGPALQNIWETIQSALNGN